MELKKIKVICENTSGELIVEMGSTLLDVIAQTGENGRAKYLAAYVNNRIRELSYVIYEPVTVKFIDITHFEGQRVYERTLFFVLSKAIRDLWPECTFHIKHSVSRGYYSEIEGLDKITDEVCEKIKARTQELISLGLPIVRNRMPSSEAEAIYTKLGYGDKLALMQTRPALYVTVWTLDDIAGSFYGALAPSTSYLGLFDIRPYYDGMYIAVPRRTDPDRVNQMIPQQKMFDVFHEYKDWVSVMGVSNIGSLNGRVLAGEASDLIKVAESFHEKKIGELADHIEGAVHDRGAHIVMISGPSSSGKTTFAKRLSIQLRVLGLTPVMISLDDYFVERELTPRDEKGDYDYEAFDAIDHATFNIHLAKLLAGESVEIPRYDFITGKRLWHENPLKLDERSILIVEGIHALNPGLTESIDDHYKFRIYISAFTSISMDNLSRIPTTDNRLIRRMVRDSVQRGADATATLQRWGSVRRGEEKYIFPYQENADVMFNSALFYEIPVLKRYAEALLMSVPDTVPEYGEAKRLLKFFDNFVTIEPDEIPPTSLLREFIGGSSFRY